MGAPGQIPVVLLLLLLLLALVFAFTAARGLASDEQGPTASTYQPYTPAERTKEQQVVQLGVVIDGNHPDTTSKVTHEEINTSVGNVEQSRRVKKILPPYLKRSVTKTREGPLRPPVVDELLVTEIRHDESGNGPDITLRHLQPLAKLQKVRVFTENHTLRFGTGAEREVANAGTDPPAFDAINSSSIIQGIRLVPNQAHVPALSSASIVPPHTAPDRPSVDSHDGANYHLDPGLNTIQLGPSSNLEKPQLPANANIWQEVRTGEFLTKNREREEEEMKFETSKSIPSLVAVSSDEELTVPADISHLLKLSLVPEEPAAAAGDPYMPQGRIKCYLLLLTGNSTIVQQRRGDFTKYLRLNLAARLSVEYDDVKVNKIVVAAPRILVNISIYAPSDDIAEESQLDLKEKLEGEFKLNRLAENNATLLELSGEEYRVVRFLNLPGAQAQAFPMPATQARAQAEAQAQTQHDQPHQTSLNDRHQDIEFVIYTILGSACACAVILTVFLGVSKYAKRLKKCKWPWRRSHGPIVIEECVPCSSRTPAVIYRGGLPNIRGSWITPDSQQSSCAPDNTNKSSSSLLHRYPGIELSTEAILPESPRHNKLRMFNCQPDRVLVRKPCDMP